MKTGFLIINYNDFETTSKLLKNIKYYKVLDKIVVVDNCSTDDSFARLNETFESDKVAIIQNNNNGGYASGINFGCRFLIDELGDCNIFVSNSDIVIENEETLSELISSKSKNHGIIAPLIKEHEGLNRGWKIPTPFQDALLNVVYIHQYLRPKLLFYKESHYDQTLVDVEVVSGCFFLIDSKALEDVNYFDENTFLYYEENIISKKMQSIKKRISINTDVSVFHNHSITIDKNINKMNKYKELKKSQYYFQTVYNKAGLISRFLLKITEKTSYFILSILK